MSQNIIIVLFEPFDKRSNQYVYLLLKPTTQQMLKSIALIIGLLRGRISIGRTTIGAAGCN